MGLFGLVTAISSAAAVVVAISFIGYAIYKSCASEKKHTMNGGQGPSGNSGQGFPEKAVKEIVRFEDIKPSDTEVRHRNVRSKENKEIEKTQTSDFQKDPKTALLNNLSNVESSLKALESPVKCNQETQTTNNILIPDLLFNNIEPNLNGYHETDHSEVSSVTSNGTESVCSFDSTTTVTSHTSSCNFPIWHEMSDAERNCLKCRSCEEELVSTVTFPCKHPYLCGTCAPKFFSLYHRCPVCKKRIKSYDSIF